MGEQGESAERLAAFGRWLARQRDLRGLSRQGVAGSTKLPAAVIEALESGQEARMPPRAYVVGYLRAYASAVGLDADEVVLRFEEAVLPASKPIGGGRAAAPLEEVAGPAGKPNGGGRPAAPLRVVIAVALALAVAGAGVWALLRW